MVESKVGFILAVTVLFLFVANVSALIGATALTGVEGFTPPTPPTDPITFLFYVFGNIGIFFTLMTVSSEFLIFGSVIVIGITIALFYAILELIRGV